MSTSHDADKPGGEAGAAEEVAELRDALALLERAEGELRGAPSEVSLREVYARYGGPRGAIKKAVSEALASAAKERKRAVGQVGNAAMGRIEAAFEGRLAALGEEARRRELARTVDVTLPGRAVTTRGLGHLHPVTLCRREIERIFAALGFTVAQGPEVETDFYNFESMAMPKDHPARDMQDTFYLATPAGVGEVLLRTHTSPVQTRTMLRREPPIRVICPGVVYRKDEDATHSPMFHQVECLCVDEGITLADLKGTMLHFVQAFFGEETKLRLRPSFFPFTEPSAEVDISCVFCAGAGSLGGKPCRMCKTTGWMEIGGSGVVDPEVFRHVGLDAERYTGFAFGFGIDRMAMLKYFVPDIKLLYEGDARFLSQFPALAR